MKVITAVVLALIALCVSAWVAAAQENPRTREGRPERPGGPGRPEMRGERPPGPPPMPPLMAALDANRDGVLDEVEIANASNALRKLDRNGDGKLTREELRPPRPEGVEEGQGGRPGPGPRGPRPPRGEGPQGGN